MVSKKLAVGTAKMKTFFYKRMVKITAYLLTKYQNYVKLDSIFQALKLNVDPTNIHKSFKVSLHTLQKAANGETDLSRDPLFLKSLFSRLKDKFTITKDWFKKFGFNKGKPLEPLQIKGKLTYNPETGKPLTNDEWKNLTDQIVDFLGDKIGNIEEEAMVRAGLFGKLMQKMEEEGIRVDDQKKTSYDGWFHGQKNGR